jgi:hypothetical protein
VTVDPPGLDERQDQPSWRAAPPVHSRLDALIVEFADVPLWGEFGGEMPEKLKATHRVRERDSQKLAEMRDFGMAWSAALHRCLPLAVAARAVMSCIVIMTVRHLPVIVVLLVVVLVVLG